MEYKITNEGSIVTKKGVLGRPGDIFPGEDFGTSVDEFLRHGKIVEASVRVVAKRNTDVVQDTTKAPLKLVDKPLVPLTQPPHFTPPETTKPTLTGIWTLNPSWLLTKSLPELNAMIAERDATVKPFDDKAEAVAFLSQDLPKA